MLVLNSECTSNYETSNCNFSNYKNNNIPGDMNENASNNMDYTEEIEEYDKQSLALCVKVKNLGINQF